MFSRNADRWVAGLAFLLGIVWIVVPNYLYYIDAVGYLTAFLKPGRYIYLWHIYHPLFPGLWMWVFTPQDVIQDPHGALRIGGAMISVFSGLGLWATYRWARTIGLPIAESLLGAAVLGGFGAWVYFANQWASFIPAISLILISFLIVATGYTTDKDGSGGKMPSGLMAGAAGILLGLATGFHGQSILVLPGLLITLCSSRGWLKRWLWLIVGYSATVVIIWWFGAREYWRFSGGGDFAYWMETGYGMKERYWGPFHYLLILKASYLGNGRVLFAGLFPGNWSPGLIESIRTHGLSNWKDFIQAAGCVFVLIGVALSLIAGFSNTKEPGRSKLDIFASLKWGLFAAWLPLAVFSSFYSIYTARHRLFAWAILLWLLLMFYHRLAAGTRRRLGLISLVLIVVGLWGHNIIAGPFYSSIQENNRFLNEAEMIIGTPDGAVPIILESDFTGVERCMYFRLLRPESFNDIVDNTAGGRSGKLLAYVEQTRRFWISGQAIEELGWEVTSAGEFSTGETGFQVGNDILPEPMIIESISTPVGNVYLLGWE